MSDFLFRMVERAAGVATATTPQPPRTFQWMAPTITLPSHSPAASAWETQSSSTATESLPAPSPLRQSAAKFNRVTVEDRRTRRNVDFQASPQPSVPPLAVKAEVTESALSKPQPLARRPDGPITTDHEAAHFPLEEPAQKTSIHTVHSATPLPRESRPQTAQVRTPKPVSEPPVEVKIGRVEIHFDAPATPAASPAPARPSGFSEYAELRRYVSRKR
jgi:hypothetical protein